MALEVALQSWVAGICQGARLGTNAEGITVVAISPEPFATEMNKPWMDDPNTNQQFLSRIPVGRWGNPEDVGQLAAYLCSSEAGFVTGTDILINGGWIAQ